MTESDEGPFLQHLMAENITFLRESMNGDKRAYRELVRPQESNINPFMKAEAAFGSNPFRKASPISRVLLGIKIPTYESRRMFSKQSIDPGHV